MSLYATTIKDLNLQLSELWTWIEGVLETPERFTDAELNEAERLSMRWLHIESKGEDE